MDKDKNQSPNDPSASRLQYSRKINQTLFDISWAVNTTADIDELYKFIHKSLARVLDVTNFFIAIVDLENKTLHFPYHVDNTDDDFAPIIDLDLGSSLTGMVVINRRPMMLKRQALEARRAQNGVWGPLPQVWMGVPLIVKETVIGVMAIQSYEDENAYSQDDLEVLAAVSHQIAIAIDRKRAQDALKESERRFRLLFEQSNDAIFIYDADGRVINCNHQATRMLGFSRQDLLGMTIAGLFPAVGGLSGRKILEKVFANTQALLETRMQKANGGICEVEISSRIIEQSGERIFQQIVRDISRRKKITRRLQRLGRMMEAASNEILVFECNSLRLLEANRSARANLGYSGAEFRSLTPFELMPEMTPEKLATIIRPLKSGAKSEVFLRTTQKRKNGSLYPVEIHLQLLEKETPAVLLFIVNDITDRLHMEKEKQRLVSQLHQAQKMEAIGILAGGIAHDFNNILASIIGYTELARYDVDNPSRLKGHLEEIFKAGNRAKELVRQILSFAHQNDEAVRPVAVRPIAGEALKLIRASLPTTIEIRPRIESRASIMGNPTQIHQIFMNLCTNAAQAMEKSGGVLTVEVTDVVLDAQQARQFQRLGPGPYLRIRVADTGTGIAPEILPSIFEPYFTTKAPGEGTGMGLAIVHGVVNHAGGEIRVTSNPGQGSLFEIHFPIVANDTGVRPKAELLPAAGRERILFVDDEASIAAISKQLLQHLGYTVTTCDSSVKALELFKADPDGFDLVITDMTMPRMTGDILAAKILAIRPEIPVILCTGYSKTFSPDDAAVSGIKAYLHKPVPIAELASKIRQVLDDLRAAKDSPQIE